MNLARLNVRSSNVMTWMFTMEKQKYDGGGRHCEETVYNSGEWTQVWWNFFKNLPMILPKWEKDSTWLNWIWDKLPSSRTLMGKCITGKLPMAGEKKNNKNERQNNILVFFFPALSINTQKSFLDPAMIFHLLYCLQIMLTSLLMHHHIDVQHLTRATLVAQ